MCLAFFRFRLLGVPISRDAQRLRYPVPANYCYYYNNNYNKYYYTYYTRNY